MKRKSFLMGMAVLCSFAMLAACNSQTPASSPDVTSETPSTPSSETTSSSDKQDYLEEGKVSPKGKQKGFIDSKGKYNPDFSSLAEERVAAKKVNIQVAEEGDVLLKNNGVLPLSGRNVSMFGYRTADIMMGGGGSGSGRPGQYGVPKTTLEQGMIDAGFNPNPRLLSYYASQSSEVPASEIPESIQSTYSRYNDAAIVMVSRSGNEGRDEATYGVDKTDENVHFLELTSTEKDLIRHAKAKFGKVVLIVNSANAMELGEENAEKTSDNLGVDAILWVGHTGNDGAAAIGSILNGDVCPSGKTADTYAADFTKDPTFTNFGSNAQNKDASGNRLDNNIYVGDTKTDYHAMEYREGIYVGYRYYETKAASAGESWYKENVVYPFGYGLSYTSFEWSIDPSIRKTAAISDPRSTLTVKVKVKNTGKMAGKDIVEMYYTAPYSEGGIEKSAVNLGAFAKTDLLQPGEEQVVTLQMVAQDMASFDWNDANNNNFVGYELEKGSYTISIRRNAHEVVDSVTRTIDKDIQVTTDYTSGATISSLFTGAAGLEAYKSTCASLENNMMSRSNGLVIPAASSKADRTISAGSLAALDGEKEYFSFQDKESDPWYVSSVPGTWDQNVGTRDASGKTAVQLKDLMGVAYTEPTVKDGVATPATDEGTKKWDAFLNQMTFRELATIVSYGGFGQPGIDAIGKKANGAYDAAAHPFWNSTMFGASYPSTQMGTNWCVPAVWACTWNTELITEIGRMTGNEGLFFNDAGLYGFSLNIHRSPFGGRNFEYLSEDGLLAGKMGAALSRGTTAKGLVTYTKHFMMNNQETNRNTNGGYFGYATEQAIREIYGRPFELAVKEGNTSGFMTAFNRIGTSTCSTNYALLERLTRDEWGFSGHNVTDYMDYKNYRYTNLMTRCGNELPLGGPNHLIGAGKGGVSSTTEGSWDATKKMVLVAADLSKAEQADTFRVAGDETSAAALETVASPTQYFAIRKAAQRVLYSNANGNSILNGNDYQLSGSTVTLALNKLLGVRGWGSFTPGKSVSSIVRPAFGERDDVGDYTLLSGTLPTGLTLSDDGATILGTPTVAGSYPVVFGAVKDGWCMIQVSVTIVVA